MSNLLIGSLIFVAIGMVALAPLAYYVGEKLSAPRRRVIRRKAR